MADRYYIISEKLANAILNYLVNKPFIEVAHIVQGLQGLSPLPMDMQKQLFLDVKDQKSQSNN